MEMRFVFDVYNDDLSSVSKSICIILATNVILCHSISVTVIDFLSRMFFRCQSMYFPSMSSDRAEQKIREIASFANVHIQIH